MLKRRFVTVAAAFAVFLGGSSAAALAGAPGAGAVVAVRNATAHPGVTKNTITLGVLTALSGPAASSFGQPVLQGAQAAVNVVNKNGGIFGRKIKLISADDGSTPTTALTAVKSLISKGAFAILSGSNVFFGGYRDTVQEGIPVCGVGLDGPEWGTSKNYNLFDPWGSVALGYPTFTTAGKYFKSLGVTKLAIVGYSNAPASKGNASALGASAEAAGIQVPIKDLDQPIGSTDYTSLALEMKQDGVNGIATEIVTASNVAIMKALKAQGVNLKGTWFQGAYSQDTLETPSALAAFTGIDAVGQFQNADLKTPATKAMMAALATTGYHKPNPEEGQSFGYFPALACIKGLQVAGKNPTWGSFIKNLRKVKGFTSGGLVAPVDFDKFAYYDPSAGGNCVWVSVLTNGAWKPLNKHPEFCGKRIPGTSNSST